LGIPVAIEALIALGLHPDAFLSAYIQTQKSALKYVVTFGVLAVHAPSEVQH